MGHSLEGSEERRWTSRLPSRCGSERRYSLPALCHASRSIVLALDKAPHPALCEMFGGALLRGMQPCWCARPWSSGWPSQRQHTWTLFHTKHYHRPYTPTRLSDFVEYITSVILQISATNHQLFLCILCTLGLGHNFYLFFSSQLYFVPLYRYFLCDNSDFLKYFEVLLFVICKNYVRSIENSHKFPSKILEVICSVPLQSGALCNLAFYAIVTFDDAIHINEQYHAH